MTLLISFNSAYGTTKWIRTLSPVGFMPVEAREDATPLTVAQAESIAMDLLRAGYVPAFHTI